MVKSPNNLQISVPLSIREKLQLMAVDNESVSLVAKRILLEALGENSEASTAIAPDALEEIRDRLNTLEKQWNIETGDRLNQLEDQLSVAKKAITVMEEDDSLKNLVERIENLEGWISSLRDDRALAKGSLGKFSDRLDALEKGKVEAAPREIPKGLTHKEMSLICGDAPSVLGKLAKNRDRWPEGYMWSEESKKWFPLEMPTDAIKTAKGLNHQEMAEICGVSLFEVTKLIHDSSKWPEGYMWSDESKKWFPMEV